MRKLHDNMAIPVGKHKLIVFCLLTSVMLTTTATKAEQSCSKQVMATCTSCHAETRICFKVRKRKNRRIWKRIIHRMVKHGAEAGQPLQDRLITCLASPPEDIRSLCEMDNP